MASFGAFWKLFFAVELSVLHALAGKPRLWLVKPAIALLCVKKVEGTFA